METLLLFLAFLTVLGFLYRRNAGWKTVSSGIGPEARKLEAHYRYLRSKDIRCRLKANADSHLGTIQTAAAAIDPHNNEHIQLDVHAQDVGKASQLLGRLEKDEPEAR
ncbi:MULTISPECIES: hypothetical protein [Paenibacillus]|uniref:hypothetical protein n=1 Tax=Paenibacillus TaxID=44249 RepID=UPI0022B8D5CB|nr:hypothetical protein [Paenibacillus caseinilyticus]MCZ8522160.1 hypothetical protein [Paenibacillus caseinilyticus]